MNKYTTYYMANVYNSVIGDDSIIGDFSRVKNSTLGIHCKIDRNDLIQNCVIGDFTYTGPFDMIFNTEIGKYTSISYGVTIGPPEHDYKRITMHPFIYNEEYKILDKKDILRNNKFDKKCTIGNDVWIGCNSTVLRGVDIPDGVVVGANAVVTKSPRPYSIVVGSPAKEIKRRFDDQIVEKLLEIKWWNWDTEKIKKNVQIFKAEELSLDLIKKMEEQ